MTSSEMHMSPETEKAIMEYRYNPDKPLSPVEVGIMFKKFQLCFGFEVPSDAVLKHGERVYQMIEDSVKSGQCVPEWEQQAKQESTDGNVI